ncbi:arrestin domain-containing protein 3-like [Planococcus citri]|uniref:arrestin domain-containing protein 3-like n=1 Tax=Planococcus citri TaxID=170843 RepID=UPI0031F808EA
MSIRTLDIILDKPNKVYYPGEMVTGRVKLVLDSVKKIRAVQLKLVGRAECKWDEYETYYDHEGKSQTRTISRRSTETYLRTEQCLVGGRGKFELAAGKHIYPFGVMLPIRAPASFSGSYGGVSYYTEVKIDIPMAFDKKERTCFTVLNPLNLNLFPNLRNSYKNEKNKTFCCLWCASGPLTLVVHLPKTGFVQSEPIPITLEIDNASNVTVDAVHIDLKRKIQWTAEGCHKNEDIKLIRLSLGGVEQGKSHTWSENFTIPPVRYPNLKGCSFIKINHELRIEADTGRFFDLNMHIPITIGDISLSEDANAPINTPQQPQDYPNKIPYNPNVVICIPTRTGVPMNPAPSPYPARGQPAANYPYPVVPGNQAIGAPLGVPAPSPNFIAPDPNPNAGGIPQMPPPPTAQVYSQSNYLTSAYPAPGGAVPVQQYHPELSRQPATNPECAQNAPHIPVPFNAAAGYGLTLPSMDSSVQFDKSSFLNDSKSHDAPSPLFSSSRNRNLNKKRV